MKEYVAMHEPKWWMVLVIFLTPLLIVLFSLLIMSKRKIFLFKDEDAQIDKAKLLKTYSNLDKGFFNCTGEANDERYQINW